MKERKYLALAYLSIAAPLLSIAVAILLSGWFSFTGNALSDLGHAIKSGVAPIFNFGLALGGASIVYTSACFKRRAFSATGFLIGFSLILVGTFDEVYGGLHFAVSVLLFLSLGALLTLYTMEFKSYASFISLIVGVIAWFLHFAYETPKGAAIPELISVFITIPFYLKIVEKEAAR